MERHDCSGILVASEQSPSAARIAGIWLTRLTPWLPEAEAPRPASLGTARRRSGSSHHCGTVPRRSSPAGY